MAYDTITYALSAEDQVATITLNRPERLNAVTDAMVAELTDAFAAARADDAVRAVLFTGAGRAFSSGADMHELAAHHTPERITALIVEQYRPLILSIFDMPKPVVAAIRGPAAGMAASLALACDLRMMAEDAYLLFAFTNIGLMAAAGSTWLLTHLVGYGRAYEIAAEGERVPAAKCLDWGLANAVVKPEELPALAHAKAAGLARRPTLALGLTKQAMHRAATSNLDEAIRLEGNWQQQTVAGHDHPEGVRAFFEKRPPKFTGR